MLMKLASMFLTNIFYYSKAIFKIKKRDARLFHSWLCLYELYDVYLKINCGLTDTKLRPSS